MNYRVSGRDPAATTGRLSILILAAGLACTINACGSATTRTNSVTTQPSSPDIALQRSDFLLVTQALRHARDSVRREVAASRSPWSLIARGLPAVISPSLRAQIAAASSRASHIQAPPFMTYPQGATASLTRELTGPAAGIAGLFQSYASLSERGWEILAANTQAISGGGPANTRFVRANIDLYLACVYDGHFDLALIGKALTDGYRKLSTNGGFGSELTVEQISSLADFYSTSLRLEPHSAYRETS
jgi:hypothetical protein